MTWKWAVRALLVFLAVCLYGPVFARAEAIMETSPELLVVLPLMTSAILLLTRDSFQHRDELGTLYVQMIRLAKHNTRLIVEVQRLSSSRFPGDLPLKCSQDGSGEGAERLNADNGQMNSQNHEDIQR